MIVDFIEILFVLLNNFGLFTICKRLFYFFSFKQSIEKQQVVNL
jgi:hypothetical protein